MNVGKGFSSIEKVGFVVSLVVLSLLYGYGARVFGWFPNNVLDRAMTQAEHILSPPDFVAPRVYDRSGVRVSDPDRVEPGLTLIARHWRDLEWGQGIRLVDTDGSVVHEWQVNPAQIFEGTSFGSSGQTTRALGERAAQGVHLFPDGDILFNLNYVGAVRLDACGEVVWSLPEGNHHSIERADDSTFWIPGASAEVRRASPAHPDGHPGLMRPVYHDLILRVAPDGEVLEEINVLDLLYENGLERHVVKARQVNAEDVTHLNDVEPLRGNLADQHPLFEAGDLLVSLRNVNLVFVFDPDTRHVKWHASLPFIYQHDPDFMGDGWIGVFDNNQDFTDRGSMLGGSRIVALRPGTDSTRVLYPRSPSDPFYTDLLGQWQQLDNGNLLLTEGKAGRILEVTADGRGVWEWIGEPYEESGVAEVSEGTRYALSPADVASWPCSPGDEGTAEASSSGTGGSGR